MESMVNEHQAEGSDAMEIPKPSFPSGRVKKIIKLDRHIKKVNSEALLLISISTDLFLGCLAERSRAAAIERKRLVVKVEHLRTAVRNHTPTADFLLDCLPKPSPAAPKASRPVEKPLPPGSRRIDDFFCKGSDSGS